MAPTDSDQTLRWLTRLTRVGWLSKGFVFVLIGVIAIRIATHRWDSDTAATQTGALKVVASQPLGAILLVIVSSGLIVFMVWNLAQAVVRGSTEIDPLGIAKRIGWFGLGLFYGSVAILGLRLASSEISSPDDGTTAATQQRAATDGEANATALTARLLDAPGGRVLALIVAIVVLIVAGYHLRKGLTYGFVDDLDTDDLGDETEHWIGRLGVGGFVARAFVLAVVAFFLAKAAIEFDPRQAVGLDGALRELATVMYGRMLIGLVGAGLMIAGLYDMLTFRRQTLR